MSHEVKKIDERFKKKEFKLKTKAITKQSEMNDNLLESIKGKMSLLEDNFS